MSFLASNVQISDNFYSVSLSGTKGIAANYSGNGVYYTTNSGATWARGNINTGGFLIGLFYSVSLSGLNGIAGASNGIYYTTDGGLTWTRSINKLDSSNITGIFLSVYLSGNFGIAGGDNTGIWYTDDAGAKWTLSLDTPNSSSFFSVYLSDTKGIAGSSDGNGIFYSSNSGQTWTRATNTNGGGLMTGNFWSLVLSSILNQSSKYNGIAGGWSNNGLWYTSDSGATWTQSTIATQKFSFSIFI
jgi:photosystem II stability/assembly factor-like uncharacterized protein